MGSDSLKDALRYLKFRLRTRLELKEYLLRRGHSESDADSVIEKLESQSLIDDVRFAAVYVSDGLNVHYKGPFKLKMELLKLGVSQEIIEETMERELKTCDLKEVAIRSIGSGLAEDKEKIRKKLYRRGFSTATIEEVLKEIL